MYTVTQTQAKHTNTSTFSVFALSQFSSSTRPEKIISMEGKKSSAAVMAACILIIVLLSGQQQPAAALSKFCRCYQNCYTECRKTMGTYPCNVECFQDCINGQPPPSSAAGCRDICGGVDSICGVMEPTGMAPDACVASCTNKLGVFAPNAAKINY